MELPDLITQRLGEETIESAVSLGDEDLVCFTPTRCLLYRGEGLIGDESIDVYDSDIERLSRSEGRRKTSFALEYVDGSESFSVARDRGDPVLQRLLQSVIRAAGVIDPEESVTDAYRFSELTVIITDARLIKHVGAYVWDDEYEEYLFEEVTGLDFEEGSVATGVVLSVAGRPQRFKAPSDEAKLLRRSLTEALFEYYDVDSLPELNGALAENDDNADEDEGEGETVSATIELDDSISPLVGDEEEEEATVETDAVRGIGESRDAAADETADDAGTADAAAGSAVDPEEIEAMQTRLSNLTTAVKRQNELLKEQHETIHTLIEELQRRE
jgi:predicted transcriptional regulator